MTRKISVLHFLPHCGGGVGSVLRAILEAERKGNSSVISSVVSLEHINEMTRRHFNSIGVSWSDQIAVKNNFDIPFSLVEKADIVLVHWWNHPLLMRTLFNGLPPSRLALWSHVNGFAAPQSFLPELFDLPDLFIFATKASMNAPVVRELPHDIRRGLRVIRSCAGIPADAKKPFCRKKPFQFGYVGTVEPAKMHPDFLKLCAAAKIPSRCIVAGGPAHNELRSQAERMGIGDQFEILGQVEDTGPIFGCLHVFAYPLNPAHYGSGEQVLIEAMAFGAVPVVFDNPPEKAIVRNHETGIVARSGEEFTNALRFLADNPDELMRLSEAGRKFVFDECDIEISVGQFKELYDEMMLFPKSLHKLNLPDFEGAETGSPFHLFLASCGDETVRRLFRKTGSSSDLSSIPEELKSSTRGTPKHYLHLLGHDPHLENICNRIA
jgi:glycosyltransferase involved in cell wall biosynthesis